MDTEPGTPETTGKPAPRPSRSWASHDHDAAPPTRPTPPEERGLRLFLRKLAQLLELDHRPR
ncbi:MAG: hypothetical protein M3395_03775 [Chloroflexota bacterium]|nr:hypothetical protein [Chloroflexota bacterium]